VVFSLLLQALTLAVFAFLYFYLFRSYGRLLLRLESLEYRDPGPGNLVNIETASSEFAGPRGLAIGTRIPGFQLPDLQGRTVSLSDFRGKRVLLLYWSPGCGFCEMTAEELAPMQQELKKSDIQPVLVAYGSVAANETLATEYQLDWPILPMKDTGVEKIMTDSVFENCGTPSAYMLDGEGKVEHRLVVGSDAIVDMVRSVMKKASLKKSRIEREGLKVGTPAPTFALQDIHDNGETIELDQFRGRKVLLVFSDPHCGPCDELAPDLVKLHRKHRHNGMAVVMVGRGELEENRKKALEHGIEFPVLLQDRWKLSREYGIFATPVAFLIGKDGVIMRNVAQGADEILKLAHEGLAAT
jgi:peroxiredoxin